MNIDIKIPRRFDTQEEIYKALINKHKVRHSKWDDQQYIHIVNGSLVDQDGNYRYHFFTDPSTWYTYEDRISLDLDHKLTNKINWKDVFSKSLYLFVFMITLFTTYTIVPQLWSLSVQSMGYELTKLLFMTSLVQIVIVCLYTLALSRIFASKERKNAK